MRLGLCGSGGWMGAMEFVCEWREGWVGAMGFVWEWGWMGVTGFVWEWGGVMGLYGSGGRRGCDGVSVGAGRGNGCDGGGGVRRSGDSGQSEKA